ncbi:MAG: 4Fe-4S dicluster domain-containing protein [Dehalococcoidia bacterium]|jgi:ferredoxin|nr:4Fe-4S dicluster domain-containing protein [Dehalococcoidia bacterium]
MATEVATLTRELEDFARERGADLFGVADLRTASDLNVPRTGPGADLPLAVSLAMCLNDTIVDEHDPDEGHRQSLYWHHVYGVVTPALDTLAHDVSRWLADRRFRAVPVPGSSPYDMERLEGVFSHKFAAHLAGVGWIGKNCLLLTRRFGPRVRLVTVLTDAPLEAGSTMDRRCGRCRECVNACPVDALNGTEFRADQPREFRFDAFKCSEYRREHSCGLCVAACPVGSHRKRRA